MKEEGALLNSLLRRYPQLAPCMPDIARVGRRMVCCFQEGKKLLVCGNGGSAADAEHIVGELMKGFLKRRPLSGPEREQLESLYPGEQLAPRLQGALPAIALNVHTALGTAYGNDVDPDMVFAQQVWGYGRPGDLLLAMSTSGNSRNVVNAVKVGRAAGLCCIGIGGGDGGALRAQCQEYILLPEKETYLVQELTLPVYHALCALAEEAFWDC